MLIRDARPEEFGKVGDLRIGAYLAGGFLSPDSTYAPRLRVLGADGPDPILVAVCAGEAGRDQIAGTVMLQQWPRGGELLTGPEEAEIRALAVAPGFQGAGLGRALVAAVIDRARLAGVRRLLLLTQPDMKAAHHLYELAGFARLPDRDRRPVPDVLLLAYGMSLLSDPVHAGDSQ
jgi:ribosomal protein S18 acetylase RimI-like enzyme